MNPRKPRQQKIISGTFRNDRNPANEPEPSVVTQVRRPPSYLNKYGKKFWRDVCEELVDTGVLTEVDWAAFELCCDSYGMFREAHDAIYKAWDPDLGKLVKRSLAEYLCGRNSQTSPEFTAMSKGKEMFLKYANVLGLNPVARNRIDLVEKEPEVKDPMEAIWNEQQAT